MPTLQEVAQTQTAEAQSIALQTNPLQRMVEFGQSAVSGAVERFDSLAESMQAIDINRINRFARRVGMASLAAAVVSPFNPFVAEAQTPVTPPAAPTAPAPASAKEAKALACQTAALKRPGHISGHYTTKAPNNHLYSESFTIKALKGCDALGKRKIFIGQESNRLMKNDPKDYHDYAPNGTSVTVKSNQAAHISKVYRAVHLCFKGAPGGTFDKDHNVKVRPVVRETWVPKSGKPSAPATFRGPAGKAC